MDHSDLGAFAGRLRTGPAVLFLGQSYLRLDAANDPFLSEALRKYGKPNEEPRNYHQLLESDASKSAELALAWMHERSKRLSAPDWLTSVAPYPWSSVYTSAIDAIWINSFRAPWRELQPIYEESYKPSDPRNRFSLHCTFLFGCVDRTEEEHRPPLTLFEWRKRKQVAVSLARRLPEILTPRGTFVVEGYENNDWFSPDEFLPIVDSLAAQQTHIFSASSELSEHPDVRELVKNGKLTLHTQSLAAILLLAKEAGLLQVGLPEEDGIKGRRITLAEKTVTVPHEIWLQTSRSATILDDSALEEPSRLSQEARYREFRGFLSGSNGRPKWSAYARHLAFQRHFERTLHREVEGRLSQKRLTDRPIILHGQTGTGKTVALGALAYSVRSRRSYPVLFIERRLQRPQPADIDRFCKWAEDAGAPYTLIVWDGMVSQEEYRDFLTYLTGRGRKAVLVGSCYRVRESGNDPQFIQAPAQLSAEEFAEFVRFLSSFDPAIQKILERLSTIDDSFLAALYRLLPETRSHIRTGVSNEASYVEDQVAQGPVRTVTRVSARTAFEEALRSAGIVPGQTLLTGTTTLVDGEMVGEMQDFTGLVMVPGQFGLTVPLELLMRAWGKKASSRLPALFEATDFFAWYEDNVGNIEVGPRTELEAKLIVQARMGGARMQVEYLKRLLLNIRESGEFGEARETNFAVDFLIALGESFVSYFRDISLTLRQLREERSVANPRLMLQEANLLRRWAISQDRAGILDPLVDEAFDQVQPILRDAIALVGNEKRGRKLQTFLFVELAASLASNARHKSNKPTEAIRLFEDARRLVRDARLVDATNYHAIDVLAWATRDLLDLGVLSGQSEAEALADVLHAFETTDPSDLDPSQLEKFHQRRLQYGQLLEMEAMEQDAFTALTAHGSCAGYYLRAIHLSGLSMLSREEINPNDARLARAHQYLEENKATISRDVRCLDLMLELWWLVNTRSRLFEGERRTVALTQEQWREFLEILQSLELTGESHRPVVLAYLKGLALFHLGETVHSLEVFRNVERESDVVRGRRRIIRSYVASMPNGAPRKFHGTVASLYAEGRRGEVYVDELRHRIQFIPYEFQRGEIRVNETLGEFHIAFNFLGPIADPPGFLQNV